MTSAGRCGANIDDASAFLRGIAAFGVASPSAA
jgi:hypothetical protein